MTSLIETLELPNFGHITTSIIYFNSRCKILMMTLWTKVMTSQSLFQNTFILRRSRIVNFADIIKISTIFIKTTFKDSKKLKELEVMY